MSKCVHVICEGQTELIFVQQVLFPHILQTRQDLVLLPALIGQHGKGSGGNVTFTRLVREVKCYLSSRENIVTTMLDYYGLSGEWPGLGSNTLSLTSAHDKACALEKAVFESIAKEARGQEYRFHPYFSMHEFEALLFSSPEILAEKLELDIASIRNITSSFTTVEDINNSKETAPSKRLIQLCQSCNRHYDKIYHGKTIANRIGIDAMRRTCTHFASWIDWFENLNT